MAQEMAQRQAIAALHQNVETALAPEAEPFGLAAEHVSEGEILRKWTGVESEIREDRQILAHCREDASSCPLAAQRFLAIVDEGRARSGRARVGNLTANENHAVVAVLVDGAWVILDNRWLALAPDRELSRATPLFAINENGVRQFVAPTANATLRDSAPASFAGHSRAR